MGDKKMTSADLQKIVAATQEWVNSAEGRKVTEDARKHVKETTDFLAAERSVDDSIMCMPMGL
jgi:hypothetical protein